VLPLPVAAWTGIRVRSQPQFFQPSTFDSEALLHGRRQGARGHTPGSETRSFWMLSPDVDPPAVDVRRFNSEWAKAASIEPQSATPRPSTPYETVAKFNGRLRRHKCP
jgi:hypothetical protein